MARGCNRMICGASTAGANILQPQAKFDDLIEEFNNERPHEALDMKCAAQIYTPSPRPYQAFSSRITLYTTKQPTSPVAVACAL